MSVSIATSSPSSRTVGRQPALIIRSLALLATAECSSRLILILSVSDSSLPVRSRNVSIPLSMPFDSSRYSSGLDAAMRPVSSEILPDFCISHNARSKVIMPSSWPRRIAVSRSLKLRSAISERTTGVARRISTAGIMPG